MIESNVATDLIKMIYDHENKTGKKLEVLKLKRSEYAKLQILTIGGLNTDYNGDIVSPKFMGINIEIEGD